MMERSLWHPVATAGELADTPLAAMLLGEPLVLWRDAAGAPHAWADRCPHRGTRLSLGSVHDGRLECAYHGWRFDGSGRCAHVPALPDFVPPESFRAEVHDVQSAHGLLWVRLEPGDSVLPVFDAEADARLRKLTCGPYDVATSAPRIVENFLDVAHFGFVHEGSLGDRAHAALADYRVEPTPHGVRASGVTAWQPRSNRLATGGSDVAYDYEVTSPTTAVLTKLPLAQNGYRDVIGLFVCPLDAERSRVWFRLALTDFDSDEATLRAFQDTIFAQDKPILESQRPRRLPLSGGELHCAADRTSIAYRRFLRERGFAFGVC